MRTLVILILAATLEIGGDAAIRHGLVRGPWYWLMLGAGSLVAYGLVVNANRVIDFGRLMGLYISVFFLVSQVVSLIAFGERPSMSLVLAGGLIVAGGAVLQLAAK